MSPLSARPPQRLLFSTAYSRRFAPVALALAVSLALLAACSSTTGGTGSHSISSASSPTAAAATATPLSQVPQISLAFCQRIVSVADANTIMKPATPATTIVPDNARPGGSCSYVSSPTNLVLSILFQPFPAGVSLDTIAHQGLAEAEAKNNIPPGATVTFTPVSGVGDQAEYGSITGSENGVTGYYGSLYTVIGSVEFSCFNFGEGTPTTPQQPALTQVCAQVASRL